MLMGFDKQYGLVIIAKTVIKFDRADKLYIKNGIRPKSRIGLS